MFSYENLEDFAGKKPFLGSSLKFIYNSIKDKTNNLKDLIISVIEDCYCNSYKKRCDQKNDSFKVLLIKSFLENPEEKILQYLRKDEKEQDKRLAALINSLNLIKDSKQKIDIQELVNSYGFIVFKDLEKVKNSIKETLENIK